jgi:hypothetical protein
MGKIVAERSRKLWQLVLFVWIGVLFIERSSCAGFVHPPFIPLVNRQKLDMTAVSDARTMASCTPGAGSAGRLIR